MNRREIKAALCAEVAVITRNEIYANWPRGKRSSKVGIAIRLYDDLRLQKRQRDREIVELESRIRHQQKVIEDQAKRLDAVLCGLPDPGVGWK